MIKLDLEGKKGQSKIHSSRTSKTKSHWRESSWQIKSLNFRYNRFKLIVQSGILSMLKDHSLSDLPEKKKNLKPKGRNLNSIWGIHHTSSCGVLNNQSLAIRSKTIDIEFTRSKSEIKRVKLSQMSSLFFQVTGDPIYTLSVFTQLGK
jgi:hypothetical protein